MIQKPVWLGCEKNLYPERWQKRHNTFDHEKIFLQMESRVNEAVMTSKNMYISISMGSAIHNYISSCSYFLVFGNHVLFNTS